MKLEAPHTLCTLCAVVPRDKVAGGLAASGIRRLLPQAAALLDDSGLDKDIVVIGERAPVRRVPGTTEERKLPLLRWESGWLPLSHALVLVMVRRAAGAAGTMTTRSLRGEMPVLPPSELELLRLEYSLPPATRQRDAEKAARVAVRKLALAMGLPGPSQHQLRHLRWLAGHPGGSAASVALVACWPWVWWPVPSAILA